MLSLRGTESGYSKKNETGMENELDTKHIRINYWKGRQFLIKETFYVLLFWKQNEVRQNNVDDIPNFKFRYS